MERKAEHGMGVEELFPSPPPSPPHPRPPLLETPPQKIENEKDPRKRT